MVSALISLILVLACNLAVSELIFVQELFRHGARYPIHPSDKDGTEYARLDNMAGELTSEGKRMHYLLGQRLKKDYWERLGMNNTYNSSYVYIKSTNVNRTLESGEAHFLGWVESLDSITLTEQQASIAVPPWSNKKFDTPAGPVFPNSPKFKPNAIHSEKSGSNAMNNGDFLQAQSVANCPEAANWANQGYKSNEYQSVYNIQSIRSALKAVQDALGDGGIDMKQTAQYFENYQCSKRLGKNYSDVWTKYPRQFMFIQSLVKYTDVASNDVQINATVTGFFNATLNNMNKIINNKEKEKLVLYSAHDMTIVMVLAGLRLGSRECAIRHYNDPHETSGCIWEFPDFASSLIFQLHSINSTYFVRLRYNGDYIKMPFCPDKDCPFSVFETFFKQTMRSTFLTDCGVPPVPTESKQTELIVANAVIGLFLALAVGYEIFLWTKKNKKPTDVLYQEHVEDL